VWKKRIHKFIKCCRKELAILNELKKGVQARFAWKPKTYSEV
jgi:hypothetical protein